MKTADMKTDAQLIKAVDQLLFDINGDLSKFRLKQRRLELLNKYYRYNKGYPRHEVEMQLIQMQDYLQASASKIDELLSTVKEEEEDDW